MPSDDAPHNASNKMRGYERLRARVLEARGAPAGAWSVAVLVRQGMSAWVRLDDSRGVEPEIPSPIAPHRTRLPAPEHAELLSVLTTLVFDVCDPKESA